MLVHVREVGVFGGLATREAGNKADRCTRDGARSADSVSTGEECRVFRQFAVQGSLKHKVPYRAVSKLRSQTACTDVDINFLTSAH